MYNTRKRMPNVVVALIGLVTAGTLVIPAPVAAQATTNTSNQRLRFNNAPVVVPPHGTFRVSGGVHVLLHSTLDASGGCHITGHANPQGLSVTGPTGTTYRAAGAANFTLQSTSGASGTRFHGILNLNLIGKGQAPDLKLHINVKTRPETLPGCDASKVVELIVDQLGITLPPAPGS
jgi:hypothetical protein